MSERGPASLFGQRLTSLATSNPNAFKIIVDNLKDDARSLRSVDSVLRCAVNRTVSVVCYVLDTPHPQSDLVDVFPEADQLICSLEGSTACAGPPIEHVSLLLDCLASSSPRFVRKLRVLKLRIRERHISRFVGVMAEFLPRCTNLQVLEVNAKSHHVFQFHGHGSTIAERRESMQQQIAVMCSDSEFLAPASWPSSRCLTTLVLDRECWSSNRSVASAIVSSALQTSSLVKMDLKVGAADPVDDFQSLSRLTNLTQLRLDTRSRSPEDQKLLLNAVARTTSLQRLAVRCGSSTSSNSGFGLPLSALSRLTSLELEGTPYTRLDMHWLSGAPALQHLSLSECTGVGCLTSLFPLTSLTRLDGPTMLDPYAGDSGVAAADAPASWRQGLLSLRWPCARHTDLPCVVPQLTSLTQLYMTSIRVSPHFCRMLGKLPRLAELTLEEALISELPDPPPVHLRPMLPALATARVIPNEDSNESIAALHALACWTRVADAGIELEAMDVTTHTVAVKGWSVGWLCSVLRLDSKLSNDDETSYEHPSGYALVDDEDAKELAVAFNALDPSVQGFPIVLFLGKSVSPESLLQLQVPSVLYVNDLLAGDVEEHVLEWTDSLVLTPDHFRALVRPNLEELTVENGHLVEEGAIRALVEGAAGLQVLRLENAAQLSDTSLWELCAGCQQLKRVTLTGVGKVTAAGLLPLLTIHRLLESLTLRQAKESFVGGLLASLKELYPMVEERWSVQHASSLYFLKR